MVDIARYAFRLSAWNELAGVDDIFVLIYYVKNNGTTEIEISNPKLKRRTLARIGYPDLKLDDIRPGARIMIYSKQYKVEDYEDRLTREALGKAQHASFCLVQQSGIPVIGKVWQAIEASGLRVVGARMVTLSEEDATYVSKGVGTPINGTVLGLSVAGEDSNDKVRTLASHIPERSGIPSTAVVPAINESASTSMITAFFGDSKSRMRSAKELSGNFTNCTACMILPGALSNGHGGNILAEIQERCISSGLTISALRMASFTRIEAEEFLEVYKGVVTEYVEMVNEYSRGPFIAIELTGNDAVQTLRSIAGPRDVEVGKRVRSNTLRAKYGVSAGAAGVHVTDLVDDGPLECEYLFALLDN